MAAALSSIARMAAGRVQLQAARPARSLLATGLRPQRQQRGVFSVNALAVGDKLPECKLTYFNAEGQMEEVSTAELTTGKKVVLFAVPGAFTPTCSVKHLPGFIEKSEDLKSKGVDTVACVSVNDAFVMDAWGKSVGADGKVLMLADGSAVFTKALGVELDLEDKGLGVRSRRYAMLLDDGVVKTLNLEEGGAFTISSAEDILGSL
uniref:Glutaredoxin-dependent peroxiredoxin n=1 Tax=Tetraselmis chuii TaxID=63592 RepID=A0A7S1XAE3_9CHLO|mmetsp:Transcript_72/g.120  ORF Transcript_72/g.120 Transcript_72/m.120 type:complete len:206 (+) Transcript_72:130-747(+)|eukprot:CAMPEP_0177770056 /NCGR_PEP_ID=MMETSP0491_2-20121128/10702_1 /TAXON_ID=63592 /ORGANISM="Tetraselmis chuii, Strain PLY429" /LENGTH=205 /DNA_ID=CAMNT_0019287207 /DNA_START=120 /DNA_END=737 /DNA_ORIENTATION=-